MGGREGGRSVAILAQAKRSDRSALPAALARRGAASAFRSALGCVAVSLLAALRLFPLRRLLLLLEVLTALSAF